MGASTLLAACYGPPPGAYELQDLPDADAQTERTFQGDHSGDLNAIENSAHEDGAEAAVGD